MEVNIVTKSAFTVLGIVERGKNGPEFIPPLWERFMKRHDDVKDMTESSIGYGVMDNFDESTGEFDYLAGYEVKPGTESPKGMTVWSVPKQTYAVIACTVPTIMEAYKFFREWLSRETYQRAKGPEFELYPEDYQNIETDTVYMYFPIR